MYGDVFMDGMDLGDGGSEIVNDLNYGKVGVELEQICQGIGPNELRETAEQTQVGHHFHCI